MSELEVAAWVSGFRGRAVLEADGLFGVQDAPSGLEVPGRQDIEQGRQVGWALNWRECEASVRSCRSAIPSQK
jgi:hypothetical protein